MGTSVDASVRGERGVEGGGELVGGGAVGVWVGRAWLILEVEEVEERVSITTGSSVQVDVSTINDRFRLDIQTFCVKVKKLLSEKPVIHSPQLTMWGGYYKF